MGVENQKLEMLFLSPEKRQPLSPLLSTNQKFLGLLLIFQGSQGVKKGEVTDQPEISRKSQIHRAKTLKFWKQIAENKNC